MRLLHPRHDHGRQAAVGTQSQPERAGDPTGTRRQPLSVTDCFVPTKKYPKHYPIAVDKVHYVGEPVAIVLASSLSAAEDAAERVELRYESLPPVVDIEKAIEKGAPIIHDEVGSNLSYDVKFAAGDIEAAFREAE